jgi:predicted Zn-dependent protease
MDPPVPSGLIASVAVFFCVAAVAEGVLSSPGAQLMHSARFWESHDRGDLAQAALKKLVAARPNSPEALLQLGELDLRISQFADAAQADSELARRFGGSPIAREFTTEYRFATRDRLQLASVRRLMELGSTAEARAALERLFPGAPPREALGIDYYMLLSSAPDGFDLAYKGMTDLAKRHPDDPRYQLALARFMVRDRESASAGVLVLERLRRRDDVRTEEVDRVLASGLLRLGVERAPTELVHSYLARHPDDADITGLSDEQERAREERDLLRAAALPRVLPEVQQRLSQGLASARGQDAGRSQARLWLDRSRRSLRNHSERRAAAELRAALELSRHNYEAQIDIAKSLESLASAEEAGELLATAARLAPQSTWLFETQVRWLLSHGDTPTAIDLLRNHELTPKWTAQSRGKLLAAALGQRASNEVNAGQLDSAMADLQEAIRLAPLDVWMRYRLAEDYRTKGEIERGRSLMSEGVKIEPGVPEMRYTAALYLSHIDDYEAAYAAIDAVDAGRRNEEMNALRDRMHVARARVKAGRLKDAGDMDGAHAALLEAEPAASQGIDRAAELAYSWIALGSPDHGLSLVKPYIDGPGALDPEALLTWARVLNSADDTVRSAPVLAQLRSMPRLDETERATVKQLQRALDLRRTRDLEHHRQFAQARQHLEEMLAGEPGDRQLRVMRADLDLEMSEPRAARDRYASLVAEDPDDLDTRLSYVRALTESGDVAIARAQLQAVEDRISADELELRITLARRQLSLGEAGKALHTLSPILASPPARSEMLMLAGRAESAQRHFARAHDYFEQAVQIATGDDALAARRESQAIEDRLQSSVAVGLIARHQPGSAGMSQLDAVTLPSAWLLAESYEWRFTGRADAVFLDAGQWARSGQPLPLIGTLQALGSAMPLRYTATRQTGLSPAVGFQTDTLAVDVGSTPLGFVLPKPVGSIEWRPTWHSMDITLGLARRAVTSSELAYAGLKDPITGTPWGAVVETGPYAGFGLYRPNYGISASVQLSEITGTRVLDNRFAGERVSGSWKFLSRPALHADVGVTINCWTYQHNLSNYTFGSGGYYSPQSYVSVSAPVELVGEHAGWVYDLRAAVSYSVSQVSNVAFYPNDAALQALAARSTLPAGYSSAQFPGYHSTGFGFSAYGATERQVTPGWVLGFRFDLDRTDYYHPTTIGVYVRHAFAPSVTRTVSPPRPIRPMNP